MILATVALPYQRAAARTFATSFLRYQPQGQVFILELAEQLSPARLPTGCVRLLPADLPPACIDMLYRYSAQDIVRAVQPFLLTHILATASADTVACLDVTTQMPASLRSLWRALNDHAVVLQWPSRDEATSVGGPARGDMLDCVGVRRGEVSQQFLTWWCDRVLYDWVLGDEHISVQRGLNAVPFLFADVCVLSEPTPCKTASQAHAASDPAPYPFDYLPNGMRMTVDMRRVLGAWSRARLTLPSPRATDTFCRFLMTPNRTLVGTLLPPLGTAIIDSRPDLLRAYPTAKQDPLGSGFYNWLTHVGKHEHDCAALVDAYAACLTDLGLFARVQAAYPAEIPTPAFETSAPQLQALRRWLPQKGAGQLGLSALDVDAFCDAAVQGFGRVLTCFWAIARDRDPLTLLGRDDDFVDYMGRIGCARFGVSPSDVTWFLHHLRQRPDLGMWLAARHDAALRRQLPHAASSLGWEHFVQWLKGLAAQRSLALPTWPSEPPPEATGLFQLEWSLAAAPPEAASAATFGSCATLRAATYRLLHHHALAPQRKQTLAAAAAMYRPQAGMNVAGMLREASDAGRTARGLVLRLANEVALQRIVVPGHSDVGASAAWWADTPRTDYRVTLTIVAPQRLAAARDYLSPVFFHERTNIAYWEWDTDTLPLIYGAAADTFAEIWAPSQHSAKAICASVAPTTVVRVVAPRVVLPTLTEPLPRFFARAAATCVVGLWYDALDVPERANPGDAISAYRRAVGADARTLLCIAINHGTHDPVMVQRLRTAATGLPVVVLDRLWTDADIACWLADLDVFVSLQRAESFGTVSAWAMAAGKATLATGYGGNLDFMTDGSAALCTADACQTTQALGHFPAGTEWVQPNIDEAATLLQSLCTDPDARQRLGAAARQQIQHYNAASESAHRVPQQATHVAQPMPTAPRLANRMFSPVTQIRPEACAPVTDAVTDACRGLATIATCAQLPAARVLSHSFLQHHPDARVLVLLADQPPPSGREMVEPFEVVPVSALGLRAYPNFLLHHDVAQRNAVLQPHWLSYLLKHRMVHQWVIACVHTWILGRLDAYWHALDQHAMVMTPRRRAPFADWQQLPTEQTALQQGIFNLDLLGLRRDEQAQHIVDWWIDNTAALHAAPDYALLDLLPRLQQGLGVVRAPQYGVSFWNLHERKLEAVSDALRVDGAALRCAQFAGFDAFDPATLSAQQTRHDVRLNPALTQLTQHYAAQLMAHGYRAWHAVPNHYDTLSNGVPVTPLIRKVLAMGAQRRIEIPSCAQAEVFCQFLMTPNPLFNGDEVAPVLAAILPLRRDVRAGFTRFDGSLDVVGVATWFQQCGQYEHDCVMLCTQYGQWLTRFSAFVRLQALLQHRADLTQRYPNPLSRQQFPAFAAWLREHASDEADFTADEIAVLIAAADVGRNKIVELYMASEQLLDAFPHALVVGDKTFVRWLFTDGCGPLPISVAEVYWFQEQRDHDSDFALWYLAARHPAVRERLPLAATAFGWPMYMQWLAGQNKPDGTEPPTALPVPTHLSRLAQLELLANSAGYRDAHAHAFETPSALQEFARTALPQQTQLSRADRQAFACAAAEYTPQYGVNVAGYFSYHAGLGESVRGFVQSLHTADIPHRKVFVPLFSQNNRLPDDWWKSWHAPEYRTSIIVINPDHFARAKRYLSPTFFGGRRNVAFWVWETERLPSEMAEAAAGLHAIWTASHYCARSIAASVGASTPVHVVPHGIDIPEELPVAHRQAWGIPAGHVAFGFFFDARSTFERKNPEALVRAFRQAFTAQDRVVLVLKINHGTDAPEQRARLARMADGLPVIFIDQRLSPLQMQRLVMSLDVYVSLHRAEGFGLTMAEAMALGKPIVATGYSGNLDFMDDACARLVSYTLIETDQAHGPYGRGSCWADPSVEHAAGLLRQLYDDAELRHHLGAQGRRRVTQTLSYQAVGARIRRILQESDGALTQSHQAGQAVN